MTAPNPRRQEVARKITQSTVTGGASKWFQKLLAISFVEKTDPKTGAVIVDGNGHKEMVPVEPAPVLPLYRVIGYVHSGKPGASEYGEFVKFHGQFRATNLADGVQTDAPVMILPNFLADALYGILQAPGRSGPVQVALEFGAKYDAAAAVKYVFVVHDLMPASQADPLSLLEHSVNTGAPLQLTAPAPTEAPTPAPTQAPTPAPTEAPKAAPKRK